MAAVKKRTAAAKAAAATEQRGTAAFLDQLEIVDVDINTVVANQYNPNRQSEHDFELLCRSISEDGFTRPIVVRKDTLEIVDGEHRWRACKALGHTTIACVIVEMTDAQARIATLKYNRIHGSEDANLAASVLKDIIAMGSGDWAQDSLMLDDVEMKRLMEDMATVETADVSIDIPVDMLGPSGKGLTDADIASGIDTSADETRAKQKLLAEAKAGEERKMEAQDAKIYRVVAFFSGEEAAIVKGVLGDNSAAMLVSICREEFAKQSA
ncbi:MAG: ParB/RepB/Spo0J family partition protein [Gemmatimonadota bacterium]|nr:ParB/RepB/Spo0J family partition protein [Gemmatimonadota bacterium]